MPPFNSMDAEPAQVLNNFALSCFEKSFSSKYTPAGFSSTVSRIFKCARPSVSSRNNLFRFQHTSPLRNAAMALGTPSIHPPMFTHAAICFSTQSEPPSPKPFASTHLCDTPQHMIVNWKLFFYFKNQSVTEPPIECETRTVCLPSTSRLCSITAFRREK